MLDRILSLFAPNQNGGPGTVAPSTDRLQIATCVLMLEVAMVDEEFSDDERSRILEILRTRFELDGDSAENLLHHAEKARRDSSDLWKFTNQINQHCSNAEKMQIMEEVWRVIYADGTLHGHEDYVVHKMAKLLNLTHPELIDAKMAVLKEVRGDD